MVATLEINQVSKTFKNENESVHVLDNINLTVKNGEFVTIIGPSGCGKSTLLKLIAGLDSDFDGDIIAGDHAVSGPSKDRGFIFQEHRLFPWLNVEKNIAGNLPLKKPDIRKRVDDLISLVKLKGFEKAYPRQLSVECRSVLPLPGPYYVILKYYCWMSHSVHWMHSRERIFKRLY